MAGADSVTLMTGDPAYPEVTAYVSAWDYEAGIDEDAGPDRDIIYHVYDEPVTAANAGHRSDLFMDALMGLTAQAITPSTPAVEYRLAHRYPGNTRLICRRVRKRHVGVGRPDSMGKLHDTNIVEIRAHYKVPAYPLGPEDDPGGLSTFGDGPYPFVVTNVSRGFRDVRASGVHAEGDEDKVFDDFRLRIPEIVYKFRYVYLPSVGQAISAISDALHGKTNSGTFAGRAAETLLFEAPESENRISARGDRQSDMEFQMTWFPPGWNREWDPETGTFVRVLKPNGQPPVDLADFSVLTTFVPA